MRKIFGYCEPYSVIFNDLTYGFRKDLYFLWIKIDTCLLCWYPTIKEAGWLFDSKISTRIYTHFESEERAYQVFIQLDEIDHDLGNSI